MKPPPRSFAAPPPSLHRRGLSLRLGAALIVVWAVGTAAGVLKHWPREAILGVLLAVSLVWAAHVVRTALHNRRLDQSSTAHPGEGGDLGPEAHESRRLSGGRSPPTRG